MAKNTVLAAVLIGFAAVVFALAVTVNAHPKWATCKLISFDHNIETEFGLWKRCGQTDDVFSPGRICLSYPSAFLKATASLRSAQAFGILSALASALALCLSASTGFPNLWPDNLKKYVVYAPCLGFGLSALFLVLCAGSFTAFLKTDLLDEYCKASSIYILAWVSGGIAMVGGLVPLVFSFFRSSANEAIPVQQLVNKPI
ncbi:uncharacterized protein LOC135829617 [Sycon ciliatum]|uniref:uncharacterized protein LOC135829617 n=1 Tax=Sycon ciliatum TaxID=27933 RepID=UPI0031F71244